MSGLSGAAVKTAELLTILKQLAAGAGNTLTDGQAIKGKVLRVLNDEQYSIQFGRRTVVVDSTLPLKVNDTVHARVDGTGVLSLSKIQTEHGSPQTRNHPGVSANINPTSTPSVEVWLNQVLTAPEAVAVQQEVVLDGDAEGLIQIAAMLKKAGLNITPPLLKAIRAALHAPTSKGIFENDLDAPVIVPPTAGLPEERQANIKELGEQIAKTMQVHLEHALDRLSSQNAANALNDGVHTTESDPGASFDERRDRESARWALNIQQDGAINHRVGCIPLLIDGKLVELSVALFDERREGPSEMRHEFSKVVFDLDLPHLGHVSVNLAGIGRHLDVGITASGSNATRRLIEQSDAFRTALKDSGWNVDRLRYFTEGDGNRAPIRAVLQHQVAGDSLARWV